MPTDLALTFGEQKTPLRGCLQPSPLLLRKKRPCEGACSPRPYFSGKKTASVPTALAPTFQEKERHGPGPGRIQGNAVPVGTRYRWGLGTGGDSVPVGTRYWWGLGTGGDLVPVGTRYWRGLGTCGDSVGIRYLWRLDYVFLLILRDIIKWFCDT